MIIPASESFSSVNNNRIVDVVTYYDSNEYSGHALANTVNQGNGNGWVLVTRLRHGMKGETSKNMEMEGK